MSDSSASPSAASSDADDDCHDQPVASFESDDDDCDGENGSHGDHPAPDFSASSLRLHLLTSTRALPSRAALLRSIGELAPSWRPYKMSAAERQAWYRIGGDNHDATCRTSKDWMMVGRKYENKKKFEAAAQAFCRAVRLNPHCASYYFRLGCVQCELADWGAAIESFHIAIQLAPETAKATYYFNLGYAHSEQRGWAEAIEALKRAIQIKPRKHFYHNLIAVCYRHSTEYDLAIRHYRHAIALDRIQPAYRRNLAYVYMQLKQWGAAVRTWSGALAVAPAHMQAELYRNRAFAQSERGYLAMACEDMAAALARYTSLQQRRRCQEKLDRWTSRLQGTEQAYLRQQQQLAGESYDDGGGGAGGGDPSVSYTHRRKIKQLAGLIQGEWEEWHGEDYDESNSDDEDADGGGCSRRSRRQRQRRRGRAASRGGSTTRGNGGRSGGRLGMAKQSRMAPSLTGPFSPGHAGASLTPRPPPSSLINNGREAPPLGDASSSAHIKRLIASLGLDVPWQEKLAIEAAKDRAKRRDARRARRAQRKHDRALSVTIEEGEEEAKQQQPQSEDSLSDSTTSTDSEAEPVPDPSADQSLMHSPASPAAPSAAAVPSSSAQVRLGHSMSSSSLVSSDPDPDALLADLYADDSVDPYASLSKLFIRLRIDSKYLWRFETASIHLANIHTVSEAEMKRVLPPLGPRLTLVNFLQDRIVLMRQKEGMAEGGGAAAAAGASAAASASAAAVPSAASPSFSSSSSSSAAAAAAFASRSDRDQAGRDALWSLESPQPASSVPLDETAAIAARIQHGCGRSSLSFPYLATPGSPLAAGNGAAAAAKPLPPPLNPINPSPIVPVSPHNAYPVNRPLSARDRRVLYDAKKHARSAMSPIRTYGATNWK